MSVPEKAAVRQNILALLAAAKTYSQIAAVAGCAAPPPSYMPDTISVSAGLRSRFAAQYRAVKMGLVIACKQRKIPAEVLTAEGRDTARGHLRWRLLRDGGLDAKCGIIQ